MVTVEETGDDQLTVTYARPVSAAIFGIGNFAALPSTTLNASAAQSADNIIVLEMQANITADTSLLYGGSAANIATPQTLPIP